MEEIGDCSDGTHRIEDALCVPGSDAGVENCVRQCKKHLNVLVESMVVPGRDVLREEVPMSGRKLGVRAISPILRDHLLLVGQMRAEID